MKRGEMIHQLSFWRRLVFLAMIVSMAPLLLIAFYNRMPMLDDWHWMYGLHEAMQHTDNPLTLFSAFVRNIGRLYPTEPAGYLSLALSQLVPFVFHERLQFLATYVTLVPLIIANVYSFHYLFKELFHRSDIGDMAGCVISMLEANLLPQPFSAFYWYSAAINYTTYYSLLVIQITLMVLTLIQRRASQKRVMVMCLLAFLIEGGNLITTLLHLEIMTLFVLSYMWLTKSISVQCLLAEFITAGGFLLNVTAPSQRLRIENTVVNELSIGGVVQKSITYAYWDAARYMTPVLFLSLLFLLPFIWRACDDRKYSLKKLPVGLVVLMLFLLYASTYAPAIYGEGNDGPRRVQNFRLMIYILSCVFMEIVVVWKAKDVLRWLWDRDLWTGMSKERLRNFFAGYMMTVVGLLTLSVGVFVIPKENRNQIAGIAAARSLLIGEAQGYARQMEERLELYHSDEKTILVTRPDYYPELLYYIDYDVSTTDDSFMVNEWIGKHYDKNSVMREVSEKD